MKNLKEKELEKLKKQMGISSRQENRPLCKRPTVFFGVTSKRRRRDEKLEIQRFFGDDL